MLTVHAEVEGGPFRQEFSRFLQRCRDRGVEFFRLEDWARDLLKRPLEIPVAQVSAQRLVGRAGRVSVPGTPGGAFMRVAAIIAAAGVGQRMGGQTPKPYLPVGRQTHSGPHPGDF